MIATCRKFVCAIVMLAAAGAHGQPIEDRVTPQGHRLAAELQSMDVENRWIAGAKVDWKTGLPSGEPAYGDGPHTHCSAFVAAAARQLGVYILSPPEHRQELLANAQNEWLPTAGRQEGWAPLPGPRQAQNAANLGELVVASYHNHLADKSGHIAIVLPSNKSAAAIAQEGPDVIQAATVNSATISVRAGFAGHVHAWKDQEIRYYAHPLETSDASDAR